MINKIPTINFTGVQKFLKKWLGFSKELAI